MTIDEAINHCEKVAESNEIDAKIFSMPSESKMRREFLECASEHRQLAEWLRELKTYRELTDIDEVPIIIERDDD